MLSYIFIHYYQYFKEAQERKPSSCHEVVKYIWISSEQVKLPEYLRLGIDELPANNCIFRDENNCTVNMLFCTFFQYYQYFKKRMKGNIISADEVIKDHSISTEQVVLPEVFRLGISEPPGVCQAEVSDVRLLGRDQLGEDHQLWLGLEHHWGGVDLDMLSGVQLEIKEKKY